MVPLSLAPTDVFPSFSFMSFCLHVSSSSPFPFSCVLFRPDLSLYTYTHAYSTYNWVQVAQVCYNEVWLIGCPSSLGSSSSATTHTFCLSRLFLFHLSLLRSHVRRITPCFADSATFPFLHSFPRGFSAGHTDRKPPGLRRINPHPHPSPLSFLVC